ncbi:MAG: MaoC/PaaZ C-terminal domain-containing protein [Casimicrobiaceae bacterium]
MTPRHPSSAPSAIADFEDFRLGQRFAGGERVVTADDVAAFTSLSGDRHPLHTDPAYAVAQGFDRTLVQGPFALAGFFGWWFALGLAPKSLIALLDTNWRYLAPIHVGDRLRYEMTITRCHRASAGGRGIVGRAMRVFNQEGVLTQEGSTSVLVRTRGAEAFIGQELMTRAWAERIGARLNDDTAFRSATATWDGTIGIADERDEVEFRVYRGKVLEAGVRSPNGPTFTVLASDRTWAELVSAPANDFMRQAMQGAFSVRGAAYEYLRFMRAFGLVVDAARAEFQAGRAS